MVVELEELDAATEVDAIREVDLFIVIDFFVVVKDFFVVVVDFVVADLVVVDFVVVDFIVVDLFEEDVVLASSTQSHADKTVDAVIPVMGDKVLGLSLHYKQSYPPFLVQDTECSGRFEFTFDGCYVS